MCPLASVTAIARAWASADRQSSGLIVACLCLPASLHSNRQSMIDNFGLGCMTAAPSPTADALQAEEGLAALD
jgi:hypothetical protein